MKNRYSKSVLTFPAILTVLLVSCGGGSESNDVASDLVGDQENTDQEDETVDAASVLTGVIVDSAVAGLSYSTQSQSGTTNELGEFMYVDGESITFSIGALTFPVVSAGAIITPADLAVDSSDPNAVAVNIARLLQSLDSDNNPANGIEVLDTAEQSAIQLNFDVSTSEFETDVGVINLLANSGSTNSSLVSEEVAIQHLNESTGVLLEASNNSESGYDYSSLPELTSFSVEPFDARYFKGDSPFDIHGLSVRFDVVDGTGTIRSHGEQVISTNNGACLVPTVDLSNATYLGFVEGWNGDRLLAEHDIEVADAEVVEFKATIEATDTNLYIRETGGGGGADELCIDPEYLGVAMELRSLVIRIISGDSRGQISMWFVEGESIFLPIEWELYL